jgi:hypothetical protein
VSDDSASEADGPAEAPQHPFVERLKPDPGSPPIRVTKIVGLPGTSDRPGYQRLYLTANLDYYAEFRTDDIVGTEVVSPDQSPVAGQEASEVWLRRDAVVQYTWVRTSQPVDEFDLDVRLGGTAPAAAAAVGTGFGSCGGTCWGQQTCEGQPTCLGTCQTQCQNTCNTCNTWCGQATCAGTCPGTCQTCNTQCGQATCVGTCQTCNTCATCRGATCQTCATACVHTCAGPCAETHVTCRPLCRV